MTGPAVRPRASWAPPAPPRRAGRRGFVFFCCSLLVAPLAASGIVAAARRSPRYPDRWDPRVAGLARFVETERGLAFSHPVHVEFLTDSEFVEEINSTSAEPGVGDSLSMDAETARLRALGLVDGELDLFQAGNDLTGETALAFYRFEDERIVVRGTTLDTSVDVTLVHELTHALQDQHFDLRARWLERATSFPFDALIEGDAEYVANRFLQGLTQQEQQRYYDSQEEFGGEMDLDGIPEVLFALQSAPYQLGPGLVTALRREGGAGRLDEAFHSPPTTDEQLVRPSAFILPEQQDAVPPPSLKDGESPVTDGEPIEFGALDWFVVLAERIDPHVALAAIDGWGADVQVNFVRDDAECTRVAFRGDTAKDTLEMEHALDDWLVRMPGGAADVAATGTTVTLTACDPGLDAHAATGRAADALVLPVARSQIYALLLEDGAVGPAAWCLADEVVAGATVAELLDPAGSAFYGEEGEERFARAAETCRSERD